MGNIVALRLWSLLLRFVRLSGMAFVSHLDLPAQSDIWHRNSPVFIRVALLVTSRILLKLSSPATCVGPLRGIGHCAAMLDQQGRCSRLVGS